MLASFLIATNRPYNEYAMKVVDSLCSYNSHEFEIIVCSPNPISDNRIKWVEDKYHSGQSLAFFEAYQASIGEYIYILVDDHVVTGDIFGAIDFIEKNCGKYKITTLAGGVSDEITKTERSPTFPYFLEKTGNLFNLPDFHVMPFPISKRDTIENLLDGYIFHPRLKTMHDWYLGAFLFLNGEPGLQYNGAKLHKFIDFPASKIDPITHRPDSRFFGESYINNYRLIKNYKPGMKYVYDEESDYLTEEILLSKYA